jgi:hypothetical protein
LTSVTSRLQQVATDAHRAHVMGLWSAAFIGGRLPASLANGALTDAVGVSLATGTVGLALMAGGTAALWLLARGE